MRRRVFAVLFWPMLTVWSVWLLSSTTFAQSPADQRQAYTTADPVDPARLGLATTSGRYAIRVWDGCGFTLEPGQNVLVGGIGTIENFTVLEGDIAGDVMVSPVANNELHEMCALTEATLMDPTPCFMNAEGACDVALEGY